MLSILTLAFGFAIILLSDILPRLLIVPLATFLFTCGYTLRLDAVKRFVKSTPIDSRIYLIPFIAAIISFLFNQGEIQQLYKNLLLTIPIVLVLLTSVFIMYTEAFGRLKWAYRALGFIFGLKASIFLVRSLYLFIEQPQLLPLKDEMLTNLILGFAIIEFLECVVFLFLNMQRSEIKITEMHNDLIESENRYRSLSDASFEGIAIIEDGVFIEVNNTLVAMFGYDSMLDIVGEELSFLVPKDKLSRVQFKIKSEFEYPYESKGLKKDGSEFPVEYHGKMFYTKGKKIRITAVRDMSYQKAAEEEIKNLKGILPICSFCNKIKSDSGTWENVDQYIQHNSQANVSHSLCPTCLETNYPDEYNKMKISGDISL
ncbi:MAG: PAS domain S-box protein [Fibrobacterales bacterium]